MIAVVEISKIRMLDVRGLARHRFMADCRLVLVERGTTAMEQGAEFTLLLHSPALELYSCGLTRYRMRFAEPLKPVYDGTFMALDMGVHLGRSLEEVDDKWQTIALVRVLRFKDYVIGREEINLMGWQDWRLGKEACSATCQMMRVMRGRSEVAVGKTFDLVSCVPQWQFAVESEADTDFDILVWMGFKEPPTSRCPGGWTVLRFVDSERGGCHRNNAIAPTPPDGTNDTPQERD